MIEIEELYKYYGSSRAVGPLTASIEGGEVVGLLGLNGAGKTTTLRILSCDLLPSAGTVRIDGLNVVDEPDRVRELIGYLPDTPPVYEEMTVTKFLQFAARLRRTPESQLGPRVDRALAATNLQDVARRPIASLSHGYRQRVGIAQAIVHEPKLVVLDEPSSGLDPVQLREMRKLVRSLAPAHTVLVSSHNLPEISEMCDRLLVIGDGRIVASGSEADLVSEWLSGERLEVTLELSNSDAENGVVAWLSQQPGVERVLPLTAEESGTVRFEIQTSRDVRAELASAIVNSGRALLSFARSQRELENVFTRLARGPQNDEQLSDGRESAA